MFSILTQLQCSSPLTVQQKAQDDEPVSHDSPAGRACNNSNTPGIIESHANEEKQFAVYNSAVSLVQLKDSGHLLLNGSRFSVQTWTSVNNRYKTQPKDEGKERVSMHHLHRSR